MSILHMYQLAFVATIVVTFWAAARTKRQQVPTMVARQSQPAVQMVTKPVTASIDLVKDRIRKLDQLFDDNVLSVDEYVELRKRIIGENHMGSATGL